MTALLFVTLAIVGVPSAVGGALLYKARRDAADRAAAVVDYPACITPELADLPLRRAWDNLEPHEQAELLREPPDKLREDLSLLAWMADLGVETVHAELAAVGDPWGMSVG